MSPSVDGATGDSEGRVVPPYAPSAVRVTSQNAGVSPPRRRCDRCRTERGDGVVFPRLTNQTAGSTPAHRRGGRRRRRSADDPVSKCDLLADEGGTAVRVCGVGGVADNLGLQHHLVIVRSVVVPAVEVEQGSALPAHLGPEPRVRCPGIRNGRSCLRKRLPYSFSSGHLMSGLSTREVMLMFSDIHVHASGHTAE